MRKSKAASVLEVSMDAVHMWQPTPNRLGVSTEKSLTDIAWEPNPNGQRVTCLVVSETGGGKHGEPTPLTGLLIFSEKQ